MPIDPRIALGYQAPQIESPLNSYAKFAQIQGSQQANELARMQSQEYSRGLQEQEGLRNYLAGNPDLNSSEGQSNAMRFGKSGLGVLESVAKLKKEKTETQGKSEDVISKINARYKSALDAAESPAQLAAVHSAMFNDEVLGPILKAMGRTPDSGLAAIQNAKTPEDIYGLKLKMGEGTAKFLDASKNQIFQQVSGTGTRMVAFNPLTNQLTVVPGSESQAAIAPGQQANINLQRELAGQGVTYQTDVNGNIIALPSKMQAGGAPVATPVTGAEGAPVKAKLSPLAEKTKIQRAQMSKDIDLAITEVGNAIKPGGTLEKATASGAGRLADAAVGFFGRSTPGAIAADQLRPIGDLVLKMVPRFEGPQSDKDTASYREASGQLANENIPVKRRKAAAEVVLRLLKARKNQFVNQPMAAEGVAPDVAPAAGGVVDFGSLK